MHRLLTKSFQSYLFFRMRLAATPPPPSLRDRPAALARSASQAESRRPSSSRLQRAASANAFSRYRPLSAPATLSSQTMMRFARLELRFAEYAEIDRRHSAHQIHPPKPSLSPLADLVLNPPDVHRSLLEPIPVLDRETQARMKRMVNEQRVQAAVYESRRGDFRSARRSDELWSALRQRQRAAAARQRVQNAETEARVAEETQAQQETEAERRAREKAEAAEERRRIEIAQYREEQAEAERRHRSEMHWAFRPPAAQRPFNVDLKEVTALVRRAQEALAKRAEEERLRKLAEPPKPRKGKGKGKAAGGGKRKK